MAAVSGICRGQKKARFVGGLKSNSFLRRLGGDRFSMLHHNIYVQFPFVMRVITTLNIFSGYCFESTQVTTMSLMSASTTVPVPVPSLTVQTWTVGAVGWCSTVTP
jgi:hypothetical protein